MRSETIEFEYKDKTFTADVQILEYTDNNYGADRDGKRGGTRTVIHDFMIDEVRDVFGEPLEDYDFLFVTIRANIYE